MVGWPRRTISPKLLRFVCLTVFVTVLPGQDTRPVREQTEFSEQYPIEHPATIPPAALKALLHTKEVSENLRDLDEAERKNPAQFFVAGQVHLGPPGEVDLVVEGILPMTGADNQWFWIILSAHKNPTVALFAGGYSLDIMTTRTNGHRDIRVPGHLLKKQLRTSTNLTEIPTGFGKREDGRCRLGKLRRPQGPGQFPQET